MRFLTRSGVAIALLASAFVIGCGSGSSTEDGSADSGGTPFGFTMGTNCFDVTAVSNVNDGCMLAVGSVVGTALPVDYDPNTGTLTVGTAGSLGAGVITFNMGTLMRNGMTSDAMMPTCTWHQTDTSMVTVTANNEFDIAVTETQTMFAAACSGPPAGGMCTSTWTWKLKKGSKTPPGCM